MRQLILFVTCINQRPQVIDFQELTLEEQEKLSERELKNYQITEMNYKVETCRIKLRHIIIHCLGLLAVSLSLLNLSAILSITILTVVLVVGIFGYRSYLDLKYALVERRIWTQIFRAWGL